MIQPSVSAAVSRPTLICIYGALNIGAGSCDTTACRKNAATDARRTDETPVLVLVLTRRVKPSKYRSRDRQISGITQKIHTTSHRTGQREYTKDLNGDSQREPVPACTCNDDGTVVMVMMAVVRGE